MFTRNTISQDAGPGPQLSTQTINPTAMRFVDAASYRSGLKFTAVINHKGQLANCTSTYTKGPLVAEQVAIALAIVNDSMEVIFSD